MNSKKEETKYLNNILTRAAVENRSSWLGEISFCENENWFDFWLLLGVLDEQHNERANTEIIISFNHDFIKYDPQVHFEIQSICSQEVHSKH